MYNRIITNKSENLIVYKRILIQFFRKFETLLIRSIGQALLVAAVLVIAGCTGMPDSGTRPPAAASRMPLGHPTSPPMGAVLFCESNAGECPHRALPASQPVALSAGQWAELNAVQQAVNQSIIPTARADIAWHYAAGGVGNCVQYALEKRRRLLQQGWPAAALELATVVTPSNARHLVLVVATTQGDWVLDNLRPGIAGWDELPYHWTARQQGPSLRNWVSIALRG